MREKGRGFDYLELIAAVAVVFICVVLTLKISVKIAVEAEQDAMNAVVRSLESALTNLSTEYLLKNDAAGLHRWDRANPIRLLTIKPDNYAGRFSDRDNKPASGNWYFDKSHKRLVYAVVHSKSFSGIVEDGVAQARYQLRFIYADNNGNGRFDAGTDEAQELRLVPEQTYRWLN